MLDLKRRNSYGQKCAKYVLNEIGDIYAMSKYEIVFAVVGNVFEYSKKREL